METNMDIENEDDSIFQMMIDCGLEAWVRSTDTVGACPVGYLLDRYRTWHDDPDTWKAGNGRTTSIEALRGGHVHNIVHRSMRPWAVGWATSALSRLNVLSIEERGAHKAVEDEVRAFLRAVQNDTKLQDEMIIEFVPQGENLIYEAMERGLLEREDPAAPRYHPQSTNYVEQAKKAAEIFVQKYRTGERIYGTKH